MIYCVKMAACSHMIFYFQFRSCACNRNWQAPSPPQVALSVLSQGALPQTTEVYLVAIELVQWLFDNH